MTTNDNQTTQVFEEWSVGVLEGWEIDMMGKYQPMINDQLSNYQLHPQSLNLRYARDKVFKVIRFEVGSAFEITINKFLLGHFR